MNSHVQQALSRRRVCAGRSNICLMKITFLMGLFKYIPVGEIFISSVLLYGLFALESNSEGLLPTTFMLTYTLLSTPSKNLA